jgi:GDP-L-fucose synthase
MKNVLITGGSGLIGNGIKSFINKNHKNGVEYNFIFLNSSDCDLRNFNSVRLLFQLHNPNYVIHLAARVGGLYANMKYPVEFYRDNILMNDNIMQLCKEFKVEKLISCLSTCIFPDKTIYPIDETMIHDGAPHFSNESYAYTKRMIDIMNNSYNREYGCNFTSIIPTNVYGKYDNFNLENAHVIPSLIHKAYIAKRDNKDFIIYGSGKPLRQFIYNEDLGELIINIMKNYESTEPIILSVDEKDEISIKDVAFIIADAFEIDHDRIIFDESKADGQYKKTASNKKLRNILPEYKFTELKNGIQNTCEWFIKNYNICRI